MRQRYWDGAAWTQDVAPTSPSEDAPQSLTSTESTPEPAEAAVLGAWKSSVGFSLLGAFVGFPAAIVLTLLVSTLLVTLLGLTGADIHYESLVISIAASVFFVLTLVYAIKFYPSFFSAKPRFKSSRTISFLNLVFGWFVFGLLWNRNLTKKTKGKSSKVLVTITACMLAYMIASIVVTIGIGLTYGKALEDRLSSDLRIREVGSAQEGGSRTFIDAETLTGFEIPSTWQAMSPDEGDPFADVQFSDQAGGYSASYGSHDYWNDMSVGDRRGIRPSDVNMDYFSEPEIAQLLDVRSVEKVSFNGLADGSVSYFKYAQDGDSGAAQGKQVWLFRIENGFIQTLRFSGSEQHYNDEFSAFAGSLQKVTRTQRDAGLLNMGLKEPRAPWEQIAASQFPTEILPWFTDRVLRAAPYYVAGGNLLTVLSRSVPLLQGYNVETYDPASQTYAAVTMTRGQIVGLLFGP